MEPTAARYIAVKQGGKQFLNADNFESKLEKLKCNIRALNELNTNHWGVRAQLWLNLI